MAMMGYREYARHRKCALYAVQKAITSGRIAPAVNAERKEIDSEAADRLWAISTDQAMQRSEAPAAPVTPAPAAMPLLSGEAVQAPTGLSQRVEWEVPFPPPGAVVLQQRSAAAGGENVVDGATFQEWRTREQRANALAAERDLAKQDRELIKSSDAVKAFHAMGKLVAQGREQVPAQLAPQLVGLTDLKEIESRLRAAYRAADARIANEIRTQFAEVDRDVVAAG